MEHPQVGCLCPISYFAKPLHPTLLHLDLDADRRDVNLIKFGGGFYAGKVDDDT
jgi:hypothetical protein